MSGSIYGTPIGMPELSIKQGATLQLLMAVTNDDGSVFDLTVVTVAAEVSSTTYQPVATLTVEKTDIAGQLSITQATDTWAPGRYLCDLKFTDSGTSIVLKSNTFTIMVLAAVTP